MVFFDKFDFLRLQVGLKVLEREGFCARNVHEVRGWNNYTGV